MKYIFDIHKTLIDRSIILAYEGEFTQEITKSVLSMTERNLESMGEESSVKRKVFNIMVECLQNIVKHCEENGGNQRTLQNSAVFMIGKEDDDYIIVSGNPVKEETKVFLSSKLEQINNLDKEGLKTLYKEIIKSGDGLSDKGGAGLGFVDMARKSGQKLLYDFEPIGEGIYFFSLKVRVPRKGESE